MDNISIKNSHYYLKTLIETSSDAITIINSSEEVEFWSSQSEEIYGISHKDIKKKKISNFLKKRISNY